MGCKNCHETLRYGYIMMKRKHRNRKAHEQDARMDLLDLVGLDHPELRSEMEQPEIEITTNCTVAEMMNETPARPERRRTTARTTQPLTTPGLRPESI